MSNYRYIQVWVISKECNEALQGGGLLFCVNRFTGSRQIQVPSHACPLRLQLALMSILPESHVIFSYGFNTIAQNITVTIKSVVDLSDMNLTVIPINVKIRGGDLFEIPTVLSSHSTILPESP